MNRKRRQPERDGEESLPPARKGFVPIFSPGFREDLRWWYRQDPKKADRIMDLLSDVLDGDPFSGLGKPEPLKYVAAGTWSRRIDREHRLVYEVDVDRIVFLQARYHYEDG